MSRGRLNASMRVGDILAALARVNWGPFRGRAWAYRRIVLQTLAVMAREQTADLAAEVIGSASQIADRAGCHEKTVRRCLHDLEDLGLITYQRGGIWDGKPMPSVIRIIKARLVELTLAFRPKHDKALEERRRETLARLALLERARIRPRQRAENHADFKHSLSLYEKRAPNEGAPSSSQFINPRPANKIHAKRERQAEALEIWKATRYLREEAKKDKMQKQTPPREFMPVVCTHSMIDIGPGSCNACRSKAWQDYQEAQKIAEKEAERLRAEQRTKQEADEEAKGSAFAAYMRATYPDKRRSEWSDLILVDEEAARLANA